MPTRHNRIAVTKDPELAAALERVAPLVPNGVKPATLVRELALRGAEALVAEHADRAAGIQQVEAWTRSGDPPWDPEVLGQIEALAWPRASDG